jgi:betaine-aldehyde dehydrogenase
VLNVVPGPGPGCGSALAEHPLVRKISFTGSTKVGSGIMKAAADGIKRVSLELGGKSANIVFDDAPDLDFCVEKSLWSVFDNAGQDCCARSRCLVQKKVYDKFVSKFVERAKRVVLGDPLKKGTEMGPLISQSSEGARLVCGGKAPSSGPLARGFYFEPTVFDGLTAKMRLFQEEIFGPVVGMTPFATEDEAIALANDSSYGLSGTIWTGNAGRAIRVAKAVQTGVLSVNSSSSVYLEAPFGGFKTSGLGRELGMKALDQYCETKTVYLSTN